MVKILLIEYESTEKEVFKKFLSEGSFENSLHWARSITKARSILKKEDFDVIFCNFNLPDGTALEFIEDNIIIEESPFIILSSEIEVKHAIRCIKLGAFDMVAKENLNAGEIDKLITNAQRRRKEDKLRNDLERRLDENYANTRAFLDNTTDGMWSLNSEGTLLMINQIAKTNLKSNFSHYPKIGEKFFDHISEEFKAKWQPLFETALKGKNVQSIDEFFINDQFFVIECSCSPISSKKEIKGATFFAREVTERITQQKKLIENERNFRSIFQNSDVPILVESRTDNKIIDLNEACAHLHGYKVSEMMGMGIFQTIPPEHRTESQENYNLYKNLLK